MEFRREYSDRPLKQEQLLPNPLDQLVMWIHEAANAGVIEANAMVLATVSMDGCPSVRTVLAKSVDERGVTFYTNTNSRKGRELAVNPHAAAHFLWREFERQISVEGIVHLLSVQASAEYWATRPRGSQLGAWASRQGEELASREVLEEQLSEVTERFRGREVPLPHHWSGYQLIAQRVEVWQGRRDRLHDRFTYHLENGQWKVARLSP